MDNIVIIGAGQGGLQMAASLRQEGYQGRLTLVGDEPGLPYQRPPLSKAYMAKGDPAALALKPASFFVTSNITLRHTMRATRIDRAARLVWLADGEALTYDHLILATGTRNLMPPLAGIDAAGVLSLRTLAHADALRSAMVGTRHAIVIGGGFIGLEFAAMARKAGVEVTVLEAAGRLMSRAVSPAMSDAFLAMHIAMGTDVRLHARASDVITDTQGRAIGVGLTDGTRLDGDLVLIAAGVVPNTELAAEAGLQIGNGVRVDGSLRTSDPAISALGDVCSFPMQGNWTRLESVQAAVDHARHIARVLLKGEAGDYAAVPWFWSDQADWKLQIAGFAHDADEDVVLPRPDSGPLVLRFSKGRLAAVETVNEAGSHMAGRFLLGQPKAVLEAAGYDLRALLKLQKDARMTA
ncbi:NAD(P)/FAD-dependent oxidoreductase [Rhizobium sp. SSA_523]|uniref:NAD(P)/FAD-dependent oxidoreductase n=1 Tax=Rhizobium sp. SSA_523 TaxID=2952477 RepID=UPI0020910554|nr:FAD-dependent oxidoreductase [Rhizobium sp. SSA_523]MCO5733434.1 FAD-dependent oxidoreductase [Rhizobium sp. SSA_523]WKC21594.1 FAD-dependent oxidoreductase [Rhizobium sp. SSA_523]